MPLSDEQKRQILIERGYDPARFMVEESPREIKPPSAEIIPTVTSSTPTLSAPQSAWEGFKSSLVPSAASLGTSAGVLRGLSTVAPHPLVKIPAAIGSGLFASWAASKLQEKTLQSSMSPEAYAARGLRQQAASEQHPIANVAGTIIPSFMAFGPYGLDKVASGLMKLPKQAVGAKALLEGEKTALAGAGLNTGLAGGSEAIREKISGEEIDPLKIATASIIGGVLQNQPWGVGRRMFPSLQPPTVTPIKPKVLPAEKPPVVVEEPLAKAFDPETLPPKEIITELQGKEVKPSLETVLKTGEPPNRPATEPDINPDPTEKFYQGDDINYSKAWLSPEAKIKNVKDHEPGAFEIAKLPQTTDVNINTHHLLNIGWTRVTRGRNVIHFEGNPNNAQMRELKNLAIEEGKMLIEDGGKVIFDPENNLNYQPESPQSKTSKPPLTPELYEASKPLAAKRAVELSRVPEIISKATDQPVRGEAIPDARKAIVTDIATTDTPAHEISHVLLEDMGKSKLQADRDFYNRGIKLAGSKENLVEASGLRYEEINNKPLRAWFEDLGSNIKRLTRVAESSKDYERILARKLRDDRPYSESLEYIKNTSTGESLSGKPVSTPPSKALYSEESGTGTKDESITKSDKGPGLINKAIHKLDPLVDKLSRTGPEGKKAADAASKTAKEVTRLEGEIRNALVGETNKLSRKEFDSIAAYIYKQRGYELPSDISIAEISPAAKEIIDNKVHPILRKIVDLQKALPYERRIKPDPKYRGPLMVDPKVIEQLNDLPEGSKIKTGLIDDFVNHQIKYNKDIKSNKDEAIKIFNDYIQGIGSTHGTTEFKALRKAEGYGLPFSWMDKDIGRLFRRYGDRVARDLAYFKNIESNPEVNYLFGHGVNKPVPKLLNEDLTTIKRLLQGDYTRKDAVSDTAESFTRALILGPVSGVRNIVSSMNKSLIYTPWKELPKIISSFGYLEKGLKDSLQMGVNRYNTLDLYTRNDEGISTMADNFRRIAQLIRTATGANFLEQISRAKTQAQGDLIARSVVGRYAKNGGIEEAKWLNKFKDEEMSLDKFKKGEVSEEDYKRIAANFVERVEGTYDMRGLPGGLLEPTSIFYYLGSLSKWSVETSNAIKKDVLTPMIKEGDWGPFLKYTLGSLTIAGPLISMINEAVSGGKKSQYPNTKELEEKGNWDDYAHKVSELGQLAGYLGFYGDLVKSGMDISKGMLPRTYGMPSVELGGDVITEIGLLTKAINEGHDPVKAGIDFISNFILDSFQATRVAHNTLIKDPEKIERANKFRDKRVYDRMDDKKIPLMTGAKPDRYTNEDINRFKETKSFKEAVEILQQEILPRIKDNPNRRDILEGMKRNSYQTMPSDPVERIKYYNYLVKTQGKEKADEIVKDKLLQDLINKGKSKMVPSY